MGVEQGEVPLGRGRGRRARGATRTAPGRPGSAALRRGLKRRREGPAAAWGSEERAERAIIG